MIIPTRVSGHGAGYQTFTEAGADDKSSLLFSKAGADDKSSAFFSKRRRYLPLLFSKNRPPSS
jgi:hypothetical protein